MKGIVSFKKMYEESVKEMNIVDEDRLYLAEEAARRLDCKESDLEYVEPKGTRKAALYRNTKNGECVTAIQALKIPASYVSLLSSIKKISGTKIVHNNDLDLSAGQMDYVYYEGKPMGAVSWVTDDMYEDDLDVRNRSASLRCGLDGRSKLSAAKKSLEEIGIEDWGLKDCTPKEALDFLNKLIAATNKL